MTLSATMPSRTSLVLASFFGALFFVLASAASATAQDATVCSSGCDYTTIQAAINDASSGDDILIEDGTYTPGSRIDGFPSDLTLRGESRSGVTIEGTGLPSWTLYVNEDNVTLKNFTVLGGGGESIKVNYVDGFTLENVTAKSSDKSEIAISADVENATLTNVTAEGQNTAGVGFALSGVDGVTLDGVTTTGNNYGGVGLYDANEGTHHSTSNVTITASSTFNEDVPVYSDTEHGYSVSNLALDDFNYAAKNPDYQGRGDDFVFYFKQESAAVALALTSASPQKSTIQTLARDGSGIISQENNFIVGTSGGNAMSIQAAIDVASSSGTVNVNDGTYAPGSRIDGLPSGLTLRGESRNGAIIDVSGVGSGAWGIIVQEGIDNVTLEKFTIKGGPAENIKVNKNDGFTIQNVTAKSSAKSEIAISRNSTNVTVTNVTADGFDGSGNMTPGVGLALSGVDNVTLTDITTKGNKYGSVGMYDSNGSPVVRTTNVTVTGNNSFNETITVYSDAEFGKPAQNLTLDGFDYTVENIDHREGIDDRGEDFVFYKQTEAGAIAFALGLTNPGSSIVQTLTRDGSGVVSQQNNFIVGTSGGSAMRIQTALDSASTGAAVNVQTGTFTEGLDVDKTLTLVGAGDGASDASNTILDGGNASDNNGIRVNADGVTVKQLRADGYTYGLHIVEADIADLTLDQVALTNNDDGMRVSGKTVDGLTVTDSHFDDNENGWYLAQGGSSSNTTVTGVSVTNTSFDENPNKGLYAENLDHATFDNVSVVNSGNGSDPYQNGFDINLKYGTYQNLTVKNSTFEGSGSNGSAALVIKARDETYGPASLDRVTVKNNTFTSTGSAQKAALGFGGNIGPTTVEASGNRFTGGFDNYALGNATSTQVDARSNDWGAPTGPSGGATDPNTGAVANGNGDAINTDGNNNVRFDPWAQTVTRTVTEIDTDYSFADGQVTMNFSTLPEGGGDVTVQFVPGEPAHQTPGTPLSPYLDVSSTMTNYDFEADVEVDVSGYSGFGSDTRLAYYNGDTDSYVIVPGSYDGAGTFTFTTEHFTPFVFFNAASAIDVYASTDPNDTSAGDIFPNDAWANTAYEPNDWKFGNNPTAVFYVVPSAGSEFGASDVTIRWDDAKLDFISAEKTGGIYGSSCSNCQFFVDQLGSDNSARINASRLDNQNFTTRSGDYLAKLTFELKQPGHSTVDLTTLDFRYFDGSGGQNDVLATSHGGDVKAYLGDVASSSDDESTGDGLVEFEDLSLFSSAYFSGVPGYDGSNNYKVKYDVGPTADGTVYTLPQIDGQIEFEDLVIFSISYGLSGDDIYPQAPQKGSWPAVLARSAGSSRSEPVEVSVQAARRDGNELRVPVAVSSVSDLRAAHLRFEAPGFEVLGAARPGDGLMSAQTPSFVAATAREGGAAVADAAVFTERGLRGNGVVYEVRLRPVDGAASSYAGQRGLIDVQDVELRTSRNTSIEATMSEGGNSPTETPTAFALQSNYPNPFRGRTKIRYDLPESADVTLSVYDARGRRVRTILNQTQEAGTHTTTLQARSLSSGVYIVVMQAGDFHATQKVTLVR